MLSIAAQVYRWVDESFDSPVAILRFSNSVTNVWPSVSLFRASRRATVHEKNSFARGGNDWKEKI